MPSQSPIRTLIVDDEPLARENLRLLLEGEREFEIVGECADGPTAVDSIQALAPDLVFLDVRMPHFDGFEVVRRLDATARPMVVFVTAYDEYAVQAFEEWALDYLLKPFDDARIGRTLARVKGQIRERRESDIGPRMDALLEALDSDIDGPSATARPGPSRIVLRTPGRMRLVDPSDIIWIEAADYCVRVHMMEGDHLVRERLAEMEQRLDTERFLRVHRSAVVNLEHVREVQPHLHNDSVLVMSNGTTVKLSRRRRPELEHWLERHR